MVRFPFSLAFRFDASALGALRRRLGGDVRRRLHQTHQRNTGGGSNTSSGSSRFGKAGTHNATGSGSGSGSGKFPVDTSTGRGGRSQHSAPNRSALKAALEAYARLNNKHPTATKVGTGLGICAIGDYGAQRVQHAAAGKRVGVGLNSGPGNHHNKGGKGVVSAHHTGSFNLDKRRLAAFASFGAIYVRVVFTKSQHCLPPLDDLTRVIKRKRTTYITRRLFGPIMGDSLLIQVTGRLTLFVHTRRRAGSKCTGSGFCKQSSRRRRRRRSSRCRDANSPFCEKTC